MRPFIPKMLSVKRLGAVDVRLFFGGALMF
jgi:hypothetical protein